MANLPKDRIVPDEPPFSRVGVDFFGPFKVKQKRSRVKRYGVIFTCLASRAVHLEVAASLDTDSYINALSRFIARRGQVKNIVLIMELIVLVLNVNLPDPYMNGINTRFKSQCYRRM